MSQSCPEYTFSLTLITSNIPQQYVDFREAFPFLAALGALGLVGGFPPQRQTVAAKVMAARQGGRIHQDVITAVAAEFLLRDPAGGRTQQEHWRCWRGTVHQLAEVAIGSVPVHLQHG